MFEWLRYRWYVVMVVAVLFIYAFCIFYDFINKRHKMKHHEAYYLKKIFGVLLIIIGTSIASYVIYVAMINMNSGEGGLGVAIAVCVTIFLSFPLAAVGGYLLTHKAKEGN